MKVSNEYLTPWHGWLIYIVAALFYCYEYFLRISPGAMTNELQIAFGGISLAAVGHLAAYYYYIYTPMQLPVGMMLDRYGPRRLLTIACLICALGSYLFAYTTNFHFAALGRAMMGFGSAFAFVGVLSLAAVWLPARNFGLAAGLTMCLGMIGGMQGEVVLAKLVNIIGWRETMMYAGLIGLLVAIVIYLLIRDKHSPIVSAATPLTIKKLMLGVWNALKNPQILLSGAVGALLYLSLSAFAELWGVAYFQAAHHFSKLDAAKAVSMVFLGWAIGGPLTGYLSDRLGRRVLTLILCSILAAVFSTLFLFMNGLSHFILLTCVFFYGIFCSGQVITFAISKENCDREFVGINLATVNMLGVLGGVISQPLIGKLLDLLIPIYQETAYTIALSILPVTALMSAGLCYFMKDNPQTTHLL